MIRASKLKGIGLVDIDRAEKIGEVGEVFLDPEARQVAGFGVRRGQSFLGGEELMLLPASAVRAIGPDAITVGGPAVGTSEPRLAAMPRLSQVAGRRVVTAGGRALGPIGDVLIEPESGRIVGYSLDGGPGGALRSLFAGPGEETGDYIRADSDLRVGRDLIVAPDEALVARGGSVDGAVTAGSLMDAPAPRPAPRPTYAPGAPVAWNDEGWGRGTSAWVEPLEAAPAPAPREEPVVAQTPISPLGASVAPTQPVPVEGVEGAERIRVVRAPRP
jgi:sporulation protein YlmC with PRC-barrel domain